MGRPPLPQGTAKREVLTLKTSGEETKQVELDAKRAGQTKSQWLRTAIEIQRKGPPIWVKSKWKKQELDGQFIRFELRSPIRELAGVGKLDVRQNSIGEIAVDIFIDECLKPGRGFLTRIWLAQNAVDQIKLNTAPDADKIKFSLTG